MPKGLEEFFDLAPIGFLHERIVEVEAGSKMNDAVWSGLARHMLDQGCDFVLGAVSLAIEDGARVASAHRVAIERSPSPDDLRVVPRCALPLERLRISSCSRLPPELAQWIDNGAWVCGEPAWDPSADRALIPLLLPLARMRIRSLRPFLAKAA